MSPLQRKAAGEAKSPIITRMPPTGSIGPAVEDEWRDFAGDGSRKTEELLQAVPQEKKACHDPKERRSALVRFQERHQTPPAPATCIARN